MEVAKAKPCNDTAAAARTSHVSQKLTRDDSKEIARLAKKDENIVKLGHVTPNCAGCIKTLLERAFQRGQINLTKSEMLVSEEE